MKLKLNHIQHIGIPVTDISRSENFYKKLGFRNVMQSTFPHEGGRGNVVMMQLDSIIMELYQFPEGEALNAVRQRKNGHVDHVAFDVDDIDQTYTVLTEAGFFPVEPVPVFLAFWDKGCRYFNVTGPDGERLEFNQRL